MQKYLDPSLGSDNIHQFRDIIRHAVILKNILEQHLLYLIIFITIHIQSSYDYLQLYV